MSSLFRGMLSPRFSLRLAGNSRSIFSSTSCRQDKPAVASEAAEKKAVNPMSILQEGRHHKVDNLEKRFLVWAGKYKRVEDVPPTVSQETMEKARNKARIRIANWMIGITVLACIAFVYSGKQAAKRGESVQKMNLDWHQEVQKPEGK